MWYFSEINIRSLRWQVPGDPLWPPCDLNVRSGRWQLAGDGWQVKVDRWHVTGDRWATVTSLWHQQKQKMRRNCKVLLSCQIPVSLLIQPLMTSLTSLKVFPACWQTNQRNSAPSLPKSRYFPHQTLFPKQSALSASLILPTYTNHS